MTVYEVTARSNASGKGYILAWNPGTGRKTQAFADADKAINEAKIKASQLGTGRMEGASMTTGDRDELAAARKLVAGRPLLVALEEWVQANQLTTGNVLLAAEAWSARNGRVEKRVTVAAVVAEFLKAKTAAGKNVAKDHGSEFKRITEDLGTFPIDIVAARQLDAWLARWDHPVTRNTIRKRIVSIWRWAQRKSYLPRDARTEAEMTERAHEPAPVIGIINVATWRSMLAYFHGRQPELLPPLVLAGFCGLRRSEVHAQVWEDISLERKNLRVTRGKRGTPSRRMVPLCDAAITWLLLCGDRKGCVSIPLAMDKVRQQAREAKITEGKDKGKPMFPSVPENCFRHSYVSHAVAASGDIPRVSLDAGNSPQEINRHYRELVSKDEGKAWFASAPGAVGEVVPMEAAS